MKININLKLEEMVLLHILLHVSMSNVTPRFFRTCATRPSIDLDISLIFELGIAFQAASIAYHNSEFDDYCFAPLYKSRLTKLQRFSMQFKSGEEGGNAKRFVFTIVFDAKI